MIEDPPGTYSWNPLSEITQTAFFATATGSEIIAAKRSGYPEDDSVVEILIDRRPDWVDPWVVTLLGESYYWHRWRLVRRLIEAGLAKKPDTPRYYLGMISAINSRWGKVDIATELQRSPDLLKHDVWKLFEYDGDGENSLANTERFERSWIKAFLTLMQQGKLPRAKLMECAVEALERDFNHYRAKWYYEFFDRLEPSDKELKKYAPRLLGLLGASSPNVVTWALGRVEAIALSGAFDTSTLSHAIEPTLKARAKGTVLTVLGLLERQAEAFPKEASQVAATAALALAHDAADVQKATLKLLEKIASPQDEAVRYTVDMFQPTLAASIRPLATKWLESGQPSAKSSDATSPSKSASAQSKSSAKLGSKKPSDMSDQLAKLPKLSKQREMLFAIDRLQDNFAKELLEIPAAIFDGTELPRLSIVQPLVPIEDIEELIDTCARVIEDGSLVDDAERCIDGMARLCASKPKDFEQLSAPLLKRASQLLRKGSSPFCGIDPANDVLGMFYAFCTGKVIEPRMKGRELSYEFDGQQHQVFAVNSGKVIGFLSDHCIITAARVAVGDAFTRLSAPTHAGGWIDPLVLAKRVNDWTGTVPDDHDVILAMLRLAPENRSAALKTLKANSAEWAQAIAYAFGSDKVSIGKQAALWAMAARARAPWQDDPLVKKKYPDLGPDTAEAARLSFYVKTRKSGEFTFREAQFNVEPAVPADFDNMLVTVRAYASKKFGKELLFEMGGFGGRTVGAVRWSATLWPLAREAYFALSSGDCFDNLDWWEAQWQNRSMLEPLIDSGTPLRQAGLIYLCGMLAAKEPGESGLATDIAMRAIEDGRLGSDNLGEALSLLLHTSVIKPGRWQKKLAEIARTSPVHAAVIQIALQRCFTVTKNELPKDSAKLLELLYELTLELEVSITSEPCRKWLASGAATGKSAKLAKSLLAITTSDATQSATHSLLQQAIAQRTQAAARFKD